ncbi:MAG: hypothetical protein R3E13_04425 [Alphaproteobacteria bacterium]
MSKLESLQPTWDGAKGELFAENAATITAQPVQLPEFNIGG